MTGIFPLVLKIAKKVPDFKKDLELDYNNYCLISMLLNVEKIFEYNFLNNNNIVFNLQFGFRQHYTTSPALININKNIRKACSILYVCNYKSLI